MNKPEEDLEACYRMGGGILNRRKAIQPLAVLDENASVYGSAEVS